MAGRPGVAGARAGLGDWPLRAPRVAIPCGGSRELAATGGGVGYLEQGAAGGRKKRKIVVDGQM